MAFASFALSDHTSMFASHAKDFRTTDRYTIHWPYGWNIPYMDWSISILLPTFMDIMIKNQTKIYQCSIQNQPTSTKLTLWVNITFLPNGMGVGGSPDPGILPVTSTFFCQATSRLGWRIVGLAQWLRCKDFCCQVVQESEQQTMTKSYSRWWQLKYLVSSPVFGGRFPFWLIFFRWVETTN